MNLSGHCMDDGRIDRALALLAHTRALLHEMGDTVSEATAEWNLGATWTKVGRFDHALPHYERALLLLRQVEDRGGEARVLVDLGVVLLALGRRDDARISFEAGRSLAGTLGLPKVEASALVNLGGLAQVEGDLASAARFATEAQARGAVAGPTAFGPEAALLRAELPGGDATAAAQALAGAGAQVPMPSRAKLYHRLWRVTKDPVHLATSKALLAAWIERVPHSLREGLELRMPELAAIQRDLAPPP